MRMQEDKQTCTLCVCLSCGLVYTSQGQGGVCVGRGTFSLLSSRGGGGFFLACEDLGRMFDCAFLLLLVFGLVWFLK